ncbi:MAG: hypothetical protein ACOYUK_03305 [Patescibacteria group bacterium]
MHNPEQEQFSANELAIMEKTLPGRSLLEQSGDLALAEKLHDMDNRDRLISERIDDQGGREAWRKNISYVKQKNSETGAWEHTDEIKAITEQTFTRDEKTGAITDIIGTNLDREHSWHESLTYDEHGTLIGHSGEVTEGERQGETWNKSFSTERIGAYTKNIETTTGKKMVDGALQDFEVVKINYTDSQGTVVYGHQEETGKPESAMSWGEKPADLES